MCLDGLPPLLFVYTMIRMLHPTNATGLYGSLALHWGFFYGRPSPMSLTQVIEHTSEYAPAAPRGRKHGNWIQWENPPPSSPQMMYGHGRHVLIPHWRIVKPAQNHLSVPPSRVIHLIIGGSSGPPPSSAPTDLWAHKYCYQPTISIFPISL